MFFTGSTQLRWKDHGISEGQGGGGSKEKVLSVVGMDIFWKNVTFPVQLV